MRTQRLAAVATAGVLIVGIASVSMSVMPAAAKTPVGAGEYDCPSSGELTFTPPWSDTGRGLVRATLSAVSGPSGFLACGGGNPQPTTATFSGKVKFPNGNGACSKGLDIVANAKANVTYAPLVKPSRYRAVLRGQSSNGTLTLSYEFEPAGTVLGSYPSTGAALTLNTTAVSGNCASGVTSASIGALWQSM